MSKSFNPLAAELRSLQIEVSGLREREAVLVEALTEALDWIDIELEGQDESNTYVIMATRLRKALATVSDDKGD
jgi:hypothetical protein